MKWVKSSKKFLKLYDYKLQNYFNTINSKAKSVLKGINYLYQIFMFDCQIFFHSRIWIAFRVDIDQIFV